MSHSCTTDRDLTPDDLAVVVGYSATRLLAAWFGGARLHVPTVADGDHPLVALIGLRPFQALVARHGGERAWLPPASEDGTHRRDRLVAELLACGASVEAVAAHLELSPRRVEQLRSELEARGILRYAGGYRRRGRGRPSDGALPAPEILGTRGVSGEPPGGVLAADVAGFEGSTPD